MLLMCCQMCGRGEGGGRMVQCDPMYPPQYYIIIRVHLVWWSGYNVVSMLAHHLRLWPDIETALGERLVFAGHKSRDINSFNVGTDFRRQNLTL